MTARWSLSPISVLCMIATAPALAEPFKLEPIVVVGENAHPSQQVRDSVDRAFNSSRSASTIDGAVIQNLNPVNKGDALRYTATGLINQPSGGDRFGGGTKIRTFGDWGASESIDGLPAFKSAGEEGGGYGNTVIPSIAVDRISVLKGGRAVQYGDGTDGGVIETRIKSGRSYMDHEAVSLDLSSAREGQLQFEAADHDSRWDYYVAGSGFYGYYDRDPDNLDQQKVLGGLGKLGWNFSDDTRAEFLAIYDRNRPDIYRNNVVEDIETEAKIGALTVDHRLSDSNSLEAGVLATDTSSLWQARSRDRGIETQIGFANHHLTAAIGDGVRYDGSVGAEYKRTVYTRDNQWDNQFDDYAVISRNALTFDDNLILSAGLRHTWFNNDINFLGVTQPDNLKNDSVWSGQLGTSYSVLERTRLRASYATGFNRFYEKYGNFGTDALNSLGAGDEIVESRTIEIGVRQGWAADASIGSGHVDVAAYNIVQDGVPRRNAGAIESVEVDQSGLEIELFNRFSPKLSVSAGYMWVFDVEATRADGTKVNTNIYWDGQAASVPEHQFSLRADYRVTDDVGIWAAAYVSGGYESANANGVVTERDGFTRLDLGASWWVSPTWALRARIENLLDERDFGQTISGLPTNDSGKLGRVFWVGTDYTF